MAIENKQRIVGIVILVILISLLVPFLFTSKEFAIHEEKTLEGQEPIIFELFDKQQHAESLEISKVSKIRKKRVSGTADKPDSSGKVYSADGLDLNGEMTNVERSSEASGVAADSANFGKELSLVSFDDLEKVARTNSDGEKAKILKESTKPKVKIQAQNDGVKWFVQIGSFSNETKVKNLVDKLQSGGFLVYLQKISTSNGPMTRVLVGNESSKDSALTLAGKLKNRLKVSGNVISSDLINYE